MIYVAFVAFVAVLNLGLGLAAARYMCISSARNSGDDLPDDIYDYPRAPRINTEYPDTREESGVDNSSFPPVEAAASEVRESVSSVANPHQRRFEGTWSEIATNVLDAADSYALRLQNIAAHVTDPQSEPTGDSIEEIATQAKNSAEAWLTESQLALEALPAAIRALPDGRSLAGRCENLLLDQLAQNETCTSNLSMILHEDDPAAAATKLHHELQRLIYSTSEMRSKLQEYVGQIHQFRQAL